MNKLDRQLAQIVKRKGADDSGIQSMPQEYINGWYAGHLAAREAQRTADIAMIKKLLTDNDLTIY